MSYELEVRVLRFSGRVGFRRVGDKALRCGNSRAQVFKESWQTSVRRKESLLAGPKSVPPATEKLETVKDFDMSLALIIQALSRHPRAVSHYLTKYFN